MATEATLQQQIKTALEKRGAWVFKAHQSGRGRRGIPDLIACYRGRFLGIEVKPATGKPTSFQLVELHGIRAAGGIAGVARSVQQANALIDLIDQIGLSPSMHPHDVLEDLPPVPVRKLVEAA